ncbi:MAG: hypothetical protein RLY82_940 [Pseudomonadota bacterium]
MVLRFNLYMSIFKVALSLFLLCIPLMGTAQTTPPSAPGSAGRLGGGASIATIKLVVGHPTFGVSRQRVILGRAPAAITATFVAISGGTVSGRWELVTPADGIPTAIDLTPTPLLSSTARIQQRRFRFKGAFSFSLSPGERYVLAGPPINSADLPGTGRYHVVLKIDSFSSISGAAPKMPSRIAPIILEVENPPSDTVMQLPAVVPAVTSSKL